MKFFYILFASIYCLNLQGQIPKQKKYSSETYDAYGSGIGVQSGDRYGYDTVAEEVPERNKKPNEISGYYRDKNGKLGFVMGNNSKKEAIYSEIKHLNEYGGYIIKKDNLFGVINNTGEITVPIQYDSLGVENSNKLNSLVAKLNGKYGRITTSGDILLPIQYKKIMGGNMHLTLIKDKHNTIQIIFNNENKKLRKKIDYYEIYQNTAIVKVEGKYGLLKDKIILPFEYDSIYTPNNERINSNKNSNKQVKKAVISSIRSYQSLSYLIFTKNQKLGLISNEGEIIYSADNEAIYNNDSFGYYSAKKDNLFSIFFSKSKSKKVTSFEFNRIFTDGYGVIMASKDKKAGVFSLDGEIIVPFEYDDDYIAQYTGIGYRVTKEKKKGVVNKKGIEIIPPLYDDISTLSLGSLSFLVVTLNDKKGVFNIEGEAIIPVEFEWIGEENKMFKVVTSSPQRKFGLFDSNGKIILTPIYDWIDQFDVRESRLTLIKKENDSYNFMDQNKNIVLKNNFKNFAFILDEYQFINPLPDQRNEKFIKISSTNGKYAIFNTKSHQLISSFDYENVFQTFETLKHTYFSVQKGKMVGLIDDTGKIILPFQYSAIQLNLINLDLEDLEEQNCLIVVAKNNKYGVVNLKNEVKIPFIYSYIQRIADWEVLFKAKKGTKYQIITKLGKTITPDLFDDVANFERVEVPNYKTYEDANFITQALTFANGKMRVIDSKGKFTTGAVNMEIHKGYHTFDELKFALIDALNSDDDLLLKDFANKIAPSEHLLYYLKQNLFDSRPLYVNIDFIKTKYFDDLKKFKQREWNSNQQFGYQGYKKSSLTEVVDYVIEEKGIVTNKRTEDWAYSDTKFMEKLLRNAVKINGFWISTYFMKRSF